jgi:hypothetical protein
MLMSSMLAAEILVLIVLAARANAGIPSGFGNRVKPFDQNPPDDRALRISLGFPI